MIKISFTQQEGFELQDYKIFPIPFTDGIVDEISCTFIMQKMDQSQRDAFIKECHRILVPKGKLKIMVPYCKSTLALIDEELKLPLFHEGSFLKYAELFDQNAAFNFTEETWTLRSEEARAFAVKHYHDVVSAITIEMVKK